MALLVFLRCVILQRIPEPLSCLLLGLPQFLRPERRTPILVVYVATATALIWFGFDPMAVIGLLVFCGLLSADTANRLLGPPASGGSMVR